MSNTVITNYTDLNGPSSKTDSSVVVIVNKDGSLSVDQKLLGTLMGSDGSQTAGISVVRVGHEGRPDDATDSENEDDRVPHVTLSVDSYYDEPNSIIKYDSGAEMLQSLRIETRENSLVGFHNDHCYTPLKSPSQTIPQISETYKRFDDPVIEITHTPPPKPIPSSKKITIIDQQVLPKGKKLIINPTEPPVMLKVNDVLNKTFPVLTKSKHVSELEKGSDVESRIEEHTESSSVCSSGDSAPDRDSDSDYKEAKDKSSTLKLRKTKTKPRILKSVQPAKNVKLEPRIISRLKPIKSIVKKDIKEKSTHKNITLERTQPDLDIQSKEGIHTTTEVPSPVPASNDQSKIVTKPSQKVVKKEKKTPAHVSALLSDMTSLFSTPDVIRRVSTDNKPSSKIEKEAINCGKKVLNVPKVPEVIDEKTLSDNIKPQESTEKIKHTVVTKTYLKPKERSVTPIEKSGKGFDIPQLDDASLAQILQDAPQAVKPQPSISTTNVINSPGLAGPLSPTLDLLGGLQPEEDGLTEDLLMHVAQLVESSENLQEVIDKQVLGKVDTTTGKTQIPLVYQQQQRQQQQQIQMQLQSQASSSHLYSQTPSKSGKSVTIRKDPIEIVRRDGRVITLPPIEAPATRASKRKNQEPTVSGDSSAIISTPTTSYPSPTPDPVVQPVAKTYSNKKLANKKQEQQQVQIPVMEKMSAESQESWNSEDDPNRLWCICKQPHNNRFMICCDSCEDWFHGKCVNITKAMGQQMEEQGIEWRCPNCIKSEKAKNSNKTTPAIPSNSQMDVDVVQANQTTPSKESVSKTICIVCKKSARASSIYCSDACILKHAQDSLISQVSPSKHDSPAGKVNERPNSESRVIVYERKTGRLLAGPNAPTADNLKSWLQKNPTFEVVRPGTLSTIKPNLSRKKSAADVNRIQTTLNFTRIPRKSNELVVQGKINYEIKEKVVKPLVSPKEEVKITPQPKTPVTPKLQTIKLMEIPKPSTSKVLSEPKKSRSTPNRSQSSIDKAPSASPSTSRRKDSHETKPRMTSVEPIRENVRKALQEQMISRMAETDGPRFTEEEIQQFAYDTESELHELFSRDVGMKYKAKYRSLMFNIKDRKNLTLWQKICDGSITPKQLVRLSPEELASQELAQWRDKEAKHQLELIKKSELDLLAANKTYVLKTHKGEEVMENRESVSTELDPNVPVEDVVTALNDAIEEDLGNTAPPETKIEKTKKKSSRTKEKDGARHSKKGESKRDRDNRKSRSSRRRLESKDKEYRSTRRTKKSGRSRSESKDRSKIESSKEKPVSRDRSKHRSRSKVKTKRSSKDRSRSSSRARDRSQSSERSKHRSPSKEGAKRSRRSRSINQTPADDKSKHRSRSQETTKNKNDSTDSDSVERPKSATLKDAHPEYDPHEPMITSAFSEEDLRKSREDVYEESFKNESTEFGITNFDESKSFSIDTSVILPAPQFTTKPDKVSEAESDQEPTSTVENSAATVWNGCINMVDVARFYVAAHEVSGNSVDLEDDLSTELDIVGRINPDTVWDYISKMKRASNKDIIVLRLQAANDEERMQYIALYSYLSSRNRLGVVKVSNTATVKDFYIVPLPANTTLPSVLLPFDGPGLGEAKTHLLVAIIIRQRKKRTASQIPKNIIPAKVARQSRKRSYTPPLVGKSTYTPPLSPRRRVLPIPTYSSPALSTSVKDKIAATLASAEDEEAYSPGSSTSSGSAPVVTSAPASNVLKSKMEELNRQIEEQKQQILKMAQADSSMGEDEAYSPSRPMTPPPPIVPLSDIALPSNLHEILATIKQRSENSAVADVDMRNLP